MAQFLLIVTSSPDNQSAFAAVKFAQAIAQSEHQLSAVFFYAEGIYVGNGLRTPPSDEFDLTQAWQKLKQQTEARLIICSAAAQRRGVLNSEEADYHGHQDANLATHFEIGGLGEYVVLQKLADKVVQF